MFKFLHAADLHIDSPLRGLEQYDGAPVERVRGATRQAMINLVDLSIEERVAFILIAGDLFDGDWRDFSTGLFFAAQMARLATAGIPAFFVSGNHDAGSEIFGRLHLPDNVKRFAESNPESVAMDHCGVVIHGQGYATRSVVEDLSSGFPPGADNLFNIGLLHTSLNGRPGHEPYAPCTTDGLRSKGYQYWALGHVHSREVVRDDPWIVFPGNTQGRHIRETGPKGCSLVCVEDGEVSSVEHRDLDVLRWISCESDLTGVSTVEGSLDKAAQALAEVADKAEGRPHGIRLLFRGPCAIHRNLAAAKESLTQEIRAMAAGFAAEDLWIESVRLETRSDRTSEQHSQQRDALSSLMETLHRIENDGEELELLGQLFVDLKVKLPPEFTSRDDPFDPTNHHIVAEAVDDARALLWSRLLSFEDST